MKREIGIVVLNLSIFLSQNTFADILSSKQKNPGMTLAPTQGGYWGGVWYDTCYSNYELAGSYALQLSVEANAVVEENCYPQEVLELAGRLSRSSRVLYDLLASCMSVNVEYQSALDEFAFVSNDYNALTSTAGDADLTKIVDNFTRLSETMLEQ